MRGFAVAALVTSGVVMTATVAGAVLTVAQGVAQVPGSMPMVAGATLAEGRIQTVVEGADSIHLLDAGDGRVIMVDAGRSPDASALRAALKARDLGPDDIAAVLLTHGHGDHIGGLAALPQVPIYILEADADLVLGARTADNLIGRFRSPQPTGLRVHRTLSDGERFRIALLDIEVFALPGHTRGSAAYLAHGVLFLGDSAAATVEGTLVAAPPIVSADRARNRQSLRELCRRLSDREADVRSLAFAHQGPLGGLTPLLDWCDKNPLSPVD